MFSYKANAICMAGMTMPTGAGVAASHCWNRVRKPGQLINYVRFWPHRWTFAKNRTAHAQTITEKVHSGNGAVSLVHKILLTVLLQISWYPLLSDSYSNFLSKPIVFFDWVWQVWKKPLIWTSHLKLKSQWCVNRKLPMSINQDEGICWHEIYCCQISSHFYPSKVISVIVYWPNDTDVFELILYLIWGYQKIL